jgi:hypothetical protein
MKLFLKVLVLAFLVLPMPAVAQPNVTVDTAYQIRYASNLDVGDAVVNITNSGARGAGLQSGTSASITGSICANVYTFSPDEQMVSCCSCPVTPNGLVSLSAQRDLISNTLTPVVPTSIVIKLLASVPVGGSCSNSASAPGAQTSGMLAWGTTVHKTNSSTTTTTTTGRTPVTTTTTTTSLGLGETPFLPATLSAGELTRLTQLCSFIVANGSGFGICRTCQLGGQIVAQ